MKSVDRLRELAADINESEIRDHSVIVNFQGMHFDVDHEWLDSWHAMVDQLCDAIEAEVERDYMELPRDADGVPIRVGDELCGYGRPNGGVFAKAIRGSIVLVGEPDSSYFNWIMWSAEGCHQKPPTVEDVLEKALNEAAMLDREEGYWPSAADVTNIVNDYAAKLRLADGGDE